MNSFVKSRISLVLAVIVCVGLAGTSPAKADDGQSVLYVKADAAGDGTSWTDAYSDLQDALAVAVAGDQIWVAAGMYTPGGPGARTATFQLRSGIGIYGGFTGTEISLSERNPTTNLTILSGDLMGNDLEVLEPADLASESTRSDNSYHVVTGSGADETGVLDGFVITGGNANVSGNFDGAGMINVWRAGVGWSGPVPVNPTLVNCSFEWNVARQRGGGVFNSGGDLNLLNCTFRDNHAIGSSTPEHGGAGLYNLNANPIVTDCTFSRNTTGGRGAGMYNWDAAPTIIHCRFEDNAVLHNDFNSMGAGMLNRGANSKANIYNSVFIGNIAGYGGGIWNGFTARSTIVNCLFDSNQAVRPGVGRGGGIQSYGGGTHPNVINCIFSENTAADIGGGLATNNGGTAGVSNCIFWGNRARNRTDANAQIGGGTAVVTYSCVQGGKPGEGNIDADPHFVDPQNGDFRLKSQAGRWDPLSESWIKDDITSPCIDAGYPMSLIGPESFPNGGFVNMGAYGGTSEASKSYFGEPICEIIVAGDINGDCRVDRADLEIMALHWTDPEPMQP